MDSDLGENSMGRGVEFDSVKPVCCDVMKNPSEENLLKLRLFLESIPSSSLSAEVANYIIFPLVVHLKGINRLKSSAKELLVKCIETILDKSVLHNQQIFNEVFQNLNMLLGLKDNKPSFNLNPELSDELILSVEMSISLLLKELSPAILNNLYDESSISSVGHCIFMQIQVVNSDLRLDIRMKALEIIERLFCVTSGNSSMTHRVFNFIPGIVVTLRKAASANVGRPRKALIRKSLDVLSTCLSVSMENETLETLMQADSNMAMLMESLSSELVSHEEEQLRAALSSFSMNLITSCEQKLPRCCEILRKNVLIQSWDAESDDIRQSSRLFLQTTHEEFASVEESLKMLKKCYSSLLGNNSEDCELYLKLLASNLLSNNLLFVEISLLLPELVKFFTIAILQSKIHDTASCTQKSLQRICSELCQIMKEITSPSDIIEEVVPFLSLNAAIDFNGRLENNLIGTLFFINKLMLSYSKDPNSLEELLSLDLPNIASLYLTILDLHVRDRRDVSPKIASALDFENVLLIEGLAALASVDTQMVLPIVLYYLLEESGSSSVSVSSAAEKGLHQICSMHSNDFSILQLLTNNLDLIMSELSIRTSAICSHPKCPNALIFLAKYFDFGSDEFVRCIQNVFSQSCDQFYPISHEPFTKIFFAFLLSLWSRKKSLAGFNVHSQNKISLAGRIENYQSSLGIDAGFKEELVNGDDFPSGDVNDEEKTLQADIKLVVDICYRVLNFLPNRNDVSMQINCLDCLIYGVQLLQNEENVLLPLAHTIWQNLMPRFADNDLVLVRKSFELLLVLSKFTGSFMKKRIVEEVFPRLRGLLIELSNESARFHHKDTLYYTHTQSYKLQMVLLEGLAELCLSIELNEEELDQVVSGCMAYLKPGQHKNLVEAARKLVQVFECSEQGCVIWMKLYAHALQDSHPVPPSNVFTPFPKLQL